MANWFDQYFGFAPKANEQDGVWSFGIPQGQAPDVPLWPSPQMPPQSDDPFERAAQRTRQSVQPQGGRTEGMATTLPEDFLIPKTPLDYAMYAMGGPFRVPVKAAMLGVSAALGSDAAEAGPLQKVINGIKVWHASPHDFDKFDMSKVGTGQGAASYGHGIYTAENPKVSGLGGNYWNEFARRTPEDGGEKLAQHFLQEYGFDRAKAAAHVHALEGSYLGFPKEEVGGAARLLSSDPATKIGPRVYETNIAAQPKDFLDWDSPLRGQPAVQRMPELLEAASTQAKNRSYSAGTQKRRDELWDMAKNPEIATGEFAFEQLRDNFGRYGQNQKSAPSAALRDAGIPGIKYLDEGSRGRTGTATDTHLKQWPDGKYELRAYKDGSTKLAEEYGLWEDQVRRKLGPEAADDLLAQVKQYGPMVTARTAHPSHFPGTSNYVVNDDQLLTILKKYGIALPGAGAAIAGASNDAEAGPLSKVVGGAARGGVWSDLAKTTHRPVEEMSATRVPTGSLQPFKSLDPAALQGSVLTPAVGDRTAAGSILTHVNDLPLSRPVTLEGGPDFMRSAANTHDGAVWASEKAAASKMANLGRTLGADGKDVNLVYSAMGARSGDYSHMTADALLGQLGNAPITRDATATFNAAMRAQNPTWPGLKSPALRDTLMNDPAMRVKFVHEMALGQHQTAGFPDIASTRAAISEPALLGQPTGVSGYAISRLGPQSKMIEAPSVPHSTYSTQVQGGEYRGGLSTPIPREMMFPAFFEQRRAAGAPKLADDRAFTMGNVSQDATQQWLDTISQYIEQQKLLGR